MMFRRKDSMVRLAAAAAVATTLLFAATQAAMAQMGYAVVPTAIIYPGEVVSADRLEEVEVTNPKLVGEFARSISEVVGLVSKRTLLPGRTILISSLREPYAMTRGSTVRLTFTLGTMTISASGTPLVDAAVGDVIRARNLDSGMIVSGTVMSDGTIHVVAK